MENDHTKIRTNESLATNACLYLLKEFRGSRMELLVEEHLSEIYMETKRSLNKQKQILDKPDRFAFTVAKNTLFRLRKSKRSTKKNLILEKVEIDFLSEDLGRRAGFSSPLDVLISKEKNQLIRHVLNHLSAEHRTVIEKKFFEFGRDKTVSEMANEMNVTRQTFTRWEREAFRTLRRTLLEVAR